MAKATILDDDIQQSYKEYYGEDQFISARDIEYYRKRWTSLSELVKDIKQGFYPVKCRFAAPRTKTLLSPTACTLLAICF